MLVGPYNKYSEYCEYLCSSMSRLESPISCPGSPSECYLLAQEQTQSDCSLGADIKTVHTLQIQCILTFGNRSKISMEISVKLIKLRIKLDLLPMSCLWILLSRHWSRLNFTFSILNIVEYYNSREGSRKNSIHCKLTLPVNIFYLLKHVDLN